MLLSWNQLVVSNAVSAYKLLMLGLHRLLALLTVALIAAQPVMACCLVGHPAPALEVVQDANPLCHGNGMPMAPVASDDPDQGNDDCPSCDDCDRPVMLAQASDDSAVLSAVPPEFPLAALDAKFSGFGHEPTILKTGPPDDPPLPLATPITLKQRLLI